MLWVVVVSAILIVFRVYNRISGTVVIEPPEQRSRLDMPVPEFDPDAPKIGDASLGDVKESVYRFFNEETKELERVFGFDELLKAGKNSNRWPLVKPYMTMYDDDFTCKVTSDRGIVQVETVNNNPSPTQAELYDNVVIHIVSSDPESPSDSKIYMDTLLYDSERSEISTEGPLRFVSEDSEMVGTGMILIFNAGQNRIEFLKINELDYIRLKNVSDPSASETESAKPEAAVAKVPASKTKPPKSKPAKVADKKQPAVAKAGAKKKKVTEPKEEPAKGELYQCTLTEDVFIQYGDKIIVQGTEYVHIDNILLSKKSSDKKKSSSKDSPETAKKTKAQAGVVGDEVKKSTPAKSDVQVVAKKGEPAQKSSGVIDKDSEAVVETEAGVEVYITCKGGIVAKPMTSVYEETEPLRTDADDLHVGVRAVTRLDMKNSGRKQDLFVAELPGGQAGGGFVSSQVNFVGENEVAETLDSLEAEVVKPPDRFKGRRIEFDMSTGNGTAYGPVEVIFYPDPNENADPNVLVLPMIMTASRDAKFYANSQRDLERVVFNKDVVGTRKVIRPEYLQTSTFYGDKLTIDIDPESDKAKNGDIRYVSVTEGNVKMESIRTAEDVVVSHVRLSCLQFDFDAVKNIVYAVGPGDIQMDNSKAPEPVGEDKAGSLSFQRPSFGLVDGFDKLTWFTDTMQINVDGKEDSVRMAYQPIENGVRGAIIRGTTTHLQANFMPMPDGTNELATLITAGGIYYEEEGGNVFVGEDLLYNAGDSLLTISSSEKNACLLNGALVDGIEYEVDTGNVRSELVAAPGALAMPVRK